VWSGWLLSLLEDDQNVGRWRDPDGQAVYPVQLDRWVDRMVAGCCTPWLHSWRSVW